MRMREGVNVAVILLLLAVVLNVLAAFGVHAGQFSEQDLSEFGIASGFAAFIV